VLGTTTEASRFLAQSTFGAKRSETTRLISIGYDQWLSEQFNTDFTSLVKRLGCSGQPTAADRQEAFFHTAVESDDQLRQRVAYALGQIFGVTDRVLNPNKSTLGLARFHGTLAAHAFGNFRDLLEAAILHPLMGEQMGMLRNEKTNTVTKIRADESFARNLLERFTIGKFELEIDGTQTAPGRILTFDQADIEQLTRVFTGWNYAGSPGWQSTHRNYFDPMQADEFFHDTSAKTIIGGTVLLAGQTAEEDLDQALDVLFAHDNVAPFISRQLIQQLVTSNPSPAYLARVATVFNSDENGDRGNLAAVIRAILLDEEARTGHVNATLPNFGKLREPLLRQILLWRTFSASAQNDRHAYDNSELDFAQGFQRAAAANGFFKLDYSQPGAVAAAGLVSPEFQVFTEATAVTATNRLFDSVLVNNALLTAPSPGDVILDLGFETTLAGQPGNLVSHLDQLLMGGQMSPVMRSILIDLVIDTPLSASGIERVTEAIFAIVTSPEFAVQR